MARPAVVAIIASLLVAFAGGAAPARAVGCSRTTSASTDVQKLLGTLRVGAVACLNGGVYHGRLVLDRPVTIRGRVATIVGGITIDPTAVGTVLSGLTIRGNGHARAAVVVRANGVQIVGNHISGLGYRNQNTACVYLDGTRDSVVDGNRITTCSVATSANIEAPGVFAGSAYAARISNNVITRTVGFGIALGPNAQHTSVLHNLVDGNTGAIRIFGNTHTASSYNVVRNNIFSNSRGPNVVASWSGAVGKKNAVVSNCLWRSVGPETQSPGVQLAGNLVANPRYADPPADYTITGGVCAAKRPATVALRVHALGAFRVQYSLRATLSRVSIVSLVLTGVANGSRVSVACSGGCSLHWSGRATGATVRLATFAGKSLAVGSSVVVRVTKPGYAGAYARITVTGPPKGVRVDHACLAPGGAAPVSCSRYH